MGNRSSTAGHIDCIVFLAGHIYFKFVNFALKNTQFHIANLLTILGELFFTVKSETFARFLCHKDCTWSNVKQFLR